mmetsp:Transcript_97863/g.277383  ORF Transcript_97863/g.277383 Transcript_97863/m.277383 type:complete len:206 (-) Transcript_97863:407-1024(-)
MFAGRVSVISAIQRRRHAERPACFTNVSKRRLDELEAEERKRRLLRAQMKTYDTDRSGKLDINQLRKLLTDFDITTPRGTEPSQSEVDFILTVADMEGDGCISLGELEYALKVWTSYTKRRSDMEAKMREFDVSGTGVLEKNELREYLKSLNDGREVSDCQVDWVMDEADVFGNGTIHTTELVMATAAWYAHVGDNKPAKTCALL